MFTERQVMWKTPGFYGHTWFVALLLLSSRTALASPIPVDDHVAVYDRYRDGTEFRVVVDVLANDRDPSGKPLVINPSSITQPLTLDDNTVRGSVILLDDGTLIYQADGYAAGDPFQPISFNYGLFGSTRQAEVTLSGLDNIIDPVGNLVARDDAAITAPGTQVAISVLDNDDAADVVKGLSPPQHGSALIDNSGTSVLYTPAFGFTGADQFTYTAGNTADSSQQDTATITVTVRDPASQGGLDGVIVDDFENMVSGDSLDGRAPTFSNPTVNWTGRRIGALGGITLSGQSVISNLVQIDARLRPFLPFLPATLGVEDYEIEADFKVAGQEWVALEFSHDSPDGTSSGGLGDCTGSFDPQDPNDEDLDLWGLLRPTGDFTLRTGCLANGQVLATVSPGNAENPYQVFANGVNNVRLRVEHACLTLPNNACISVWINGSRAVDRVRYVSNTGRNSPTSAIQHAGLLVNASEPNNPVPAGTVWFDNVVVRAGSVREPRLSVFAGSLGSIDFQQLDSGDTLSISPIWRTQSQDVNISVQNNGNTTLELRNLAKTGDTAWLLDAAHSETSVAPFGTGVVRLSLQGDTIGVKSAQLAFDTNDPSFPTFTLGLQGDVQDPGGPPVARDDHYVIKTTSTGPLVINRGSCSSSSPGLLCNDDGTELFVSGSTPQPSHGNLSPTFGPPFPFEYEPDDGFRGTDSFVYVAEDAIGRTDTALALITVDGPPEASFSWSCDVAVCDFDGSSSQDLEDGSALSAYSWSFGDGSTAAGVAATHTFAASGTYGVTLTVTDSQGQAGILTTDVEVDFPPVARISASCDDRNCSFDGSGSSDDHQIAAYRWQFGDETAATGALADHMYSNSGTFQVQLEVVDSSGQTDSATISVRADVHPTAAFTFKCSSLSCDFDASGSSDDFGVSSYTWAFGDGSQNSTGQTVSHEFPEEGEYSVTLRVVDTFGQSGTDTQTVTVYDEETFLLLILQSEVH